ARSNFAQDYSRRSEATDMWSIGAIAFLLLCGYPPFFAPSRNAVLGRIQLGEVAFDGVLRVGALLWHSETRAVSEG
ncbi:unnamed protein product, partial [Prorocentrum cordatum]